MRVIVTRPAQQADAWVGQLHAHGVDAAALPLIGIEPVADSTPLHAVWADLDARSLVVFVSPNAVQHFFAARPADARWPRATPAGSTGPGTSTALRAAGLAPADIVEPPDDAATFDSEALWTQLAARTWAGQRVLIVRGDGGRDWLAGRLRERGAAVDFVAAYRRRAPSVDAAGRRLVAQALGAPAAHLWLFSSSEAVAQLQALWPTADWSASAAAAGHPRIVASVRAAGFGSVVWVAPTPAAVAALVQPAPSIQSAPQ